MPLGYFGTLGLLLGLALTVPLGYAYLWPRGVPRVFVFLTVALLVGLVLAVAGFAWLTAPLKSIGVSGAPTGAGNGVSLAQMLNVRFALAACGLLLLQIAFCRLFDGILSK